jgi:hypothetical protein
MVSVNDFADRAPRALSDGEELSLGRHRMRWFDTPQMPHGWDCGLIMDMTTRTFFCGDLFTQGAPATLRSPTATSSDPARRFARRSITTRMRRRPRRSSSAWRARSPATLAVMHGSAWRGDGARLLRELSLALSQTREADRHRLHAVAH